MMTHRPVSPAVEWSWQPLTTLPPARSCTSVVCTGRGFPQNYSYVNSVPVPNQRDSQVQIYYQKLVHSCAKSNLFRNVFILTLSLHLKVKTQNFSF